MDILIIAALLDEVNPFLGEHSFYCDQSFPYYRFATESLRCIIPPTIGKTPSAFVLSTEVSIRRPDLVINIGTAGGIKGEVELFKPYLIDEYNYIDADISISEFQKQVIKPNRFEQLIDIPHRNISTSDSFDLKPDTLQKMKNNNSSIKDMESASIAETCKFLNLNLVTIKVISDYLTDDLEQSMSSFHENFNECTLTIKLTLQEVLKLYTSRDKLLLQESLNIIRDLKEELRGFNQILKILSKNIKEEDMNPFNTAMLVCIKRLEAKLYKADTFDGANYDRKIN